MKHICKNCKHWSIESKHHPTVGSCALVEIKFLYIFSPSKKSDCLGLTSDEGWGAEIYPEPNFGCIHWQGKEKEKSNE